MEPLDQKSIIKKFIKTSPHKICYIAINEKLTSEVVNEIKNNYVVIDLSEDFSPFKPFLNIISRYKPTEELIRKNAYPVQLDSFLTYFKNGIADERYDIPVENEFFYETDQFIKTIKNLFCAVNDKKFIFINAQNLYADSINLIKKIDNEEFNGQLLFFFNIGITDAPKASMDFLEENSSKNNFLFIRDSLKKTDSILPYSQEEQEQHFSGSTIFEEQLFNNFDLIFSLLRNNRIFTSIEQLKVLLSWVSKKLNNFNFSNFQKRQLIFEIALDYYACQMFDEATLYLNDLQEATADDDITTASLFYLASIFYRKRSHEFAKRYALQAKERLKDNKQSPYCALLAMLDFQFVKRADGNIAKIKYLEALDQLDAHGFINNFIATGLSIPWNLINDPESRPMIEQNIEHCMEFAKKCGNMHLYSTACHWIGIIHSHYGESEEAMKWYNETNRIRTEIGELLPLMNIRNGLSYESLCRAKYKDAYNLVNEIVKNLYNINDYSRVIDVLKNISYALFFSRHFDEAYNIFVLLLHFLHIFDLEEQTNNSFLPSNIDILLFKTIIDYSRNDVIHAQVVYSQIEQNKNNITMEDKPLLLLIKALLYAEDALFEESEDSIIKCINDFKEIKSAQAHKICFSCYEYAIAMQKLGKQDLCDKYLKVGFDLAKEKNFEYYTKGKDFITVQDYLNGVETFDELKIDLAFLGEKAEKEQLLTQLHKRIHDYQFLNKVKTNNLKSSSLDKYIESSLAFIFEYTLADSVFIAEEKNNEYNTIYSINRNKNTTIKSSDWKKLFDTSSSREIGQFIYKPEKKLYFGNISQFEYKFAIIIVPADINPLSSENIVTLNIALASIQSQITIYKQDENLLFLSTTDTLSLLNNRHALQEYILCEGDKIRRYEQRKNTKIQLALAFIDLDNFKFYNDTFGHNAGDLMITCFANLLKTTCRQIDFIARFGGDEFVIVMIDTDETEAKKVYARLNTGLKHCEYFIPKLKELLGVNSLEIPTNRLLGFSMGVSTNYDIPKGYDLNEVLEYADKALYYSKENCKGSCIIWNDIKDHAHKYSKEKKI